MKLTFDELDKNSLLLNIFGLLTDAHIKVLRSIEVMAATIWCTPKELVQKLGLFQVNWYNLAKYLGIIQN